MSEAQAFDDGDLADGAYEPADPSGPTEVTGTTTALTLAPQGVVVRRNAGLAAAIGGVASAVAIAYLARASQSGAVLDWVLAGVLGLLGIGYLAAFVDARTPLLVADPQGVRIRLGRAWRGLPWGALQRVEHTPRRGLLRDGRLLLVVRNPARLIEELDGSARRQSALSRRLYGEPFALPLGLTTRVAGVRGDLTAALTALAGPQGRVVETAEEDRPQLRVPDPRPAVAHTLYRVSGLFQREPDATDQQSAEEPEAAPVEPLQASATPSPLREPAIATRVELRVDPTRLDEPDDESRDLRRPGSVNLVEDTVVWSERIAPIAREGHPVEPLLIDDYAAEPAEDPVIGPEVAAARTRLGLTVDLLADRTRIRPHVIESIEVDDFTPCGGDFYARGHLRTLARVLGIDVVPLLATYDERYADAPINPRRVFEAELATGAHGPIRGTRGGLNWSVLVAAVMALVLAWSVARLIMDSPVDLQTAPVLNGSAGVDNGPATGDRRGVPAAPEVPVVLTAAGGGAQVVVRDGTGKVVFDDAIAFGDTRTLQVSPPVRVQTSDGSLTATIDGEEQGALGAIGQRAQDIFVAGG